MTIQFGTAVEGLVYEDRQAAFGVVVSEGLLAVAAITVRPGDDPVYDLPGGGVDPGESETGAMVREFGEETGLRVTAGELLVRASQRHVNPSNKAVNNHGAFFSGQVVGETPGLQIEDNHELVWMSPEDFIKLARHEAQAWAVCVWLRQTRD